LAYLSTAPKSASGSLDCNNLSPFQNLCLGPSCGPDSPAAWCQAATGFIYNGTVDTRPAFCSTGTCPPEPPTPIPTPAPAGLSPGAIAGIVIGSLAAVGLIAGLAWYLLRKKPVDSAVVLEDAKVYQSPVPPIQTVQSVQPVAPLVTQPSSTSVANAAVTSMALPMGTVIPPPAPSMVPPSPYPSSPLATQDPRGLSHISLSSEEFPTSSGVVGSPLMKDYTYKVLAPNTSLENGQVFASVGDLVKVYDVDNTGFARVKNLYTNVEGKIPSEKIDVGAGGRVSSDLTVDELRARWVGSSGTVKNAYAATDAVEMSLNVGDEVRIVEVTDADGWAKGQNLTTGANGFLPLSVLVRNS
jgi:hypothetical protein